MHISGKEHPTVEGTIRAQPRDLERPDTGRKAVPDGEFTLLETSLLQSLSLPRLHLCHLDLFGQNGRH